MLLGLAGSGMAPARGDETDTTAPPTADIESLRQDLRSLEREIEALRGERPAHEDLVLVPAETLPEMGSSVTDRLTTVETSVGKLVAAGKTAKKNEAKKPSLVISGQVQADSVYFGQDEESRIDVGDLQDGTQFRRLRIGARGTSFEVLEYSLGVDFALANQPSYLDNYVEWKDLPWLQHVRAGHYFEPFSLERVTQNRNNTFMERSLVDTFAPARNMGVMTYGNTENERATWAIGTFRTNSDNTGNDSFDSGQALTMRGTMLPWWDEPSDGRFYLHLGAAYSYRDTSLDQVRFRNTPEIRKQQPATVFGPVGPPSPSNYINGAPGPFALFFNAYMAQVSYFLTGEHRPYDRKLGIHDRLKPFENFFHVRRGSRGIQTGLGAWEVAARFSNIVLNDENIKGNNLTDFTVGLNWYLNPYTRWKFNYVRAFLEDSRANKGNSMTDAYGMRIDFDF